MQFSFIATFSQPVSSTNFLHLPQCSSATPREHARRVFDQLQQAEREEIRARVAVCEHMLRLMVEEYCSLIDYFLCDCQMSAQMINLNTSFFHIRVSGTKTISIYCSCHRQVGNKYTVQLHQEYCGQGNEKRKSLTIKMETLMHHKKRSIDTLLPLLEGIHFAIRGLCSFDIL